MTKTKKNALKELKEKVAHLTNRNEHFEKSYLDQYERAGKAAHENEEMRRQLSDMLGKYMNRNGFYIQNRIYGWDGIIATVSALLNELKVNEDMGHIVAASRDKEVRNLWDAMRIALHDPRLLNAKEDVRGCGNQGDAGFF